MGRGHILRNEKKVSMPQKIVGEDDSSILENSGQHSEHAGCTSLAYQNIYMIEKYSIKIQYKAV